jgi:hypothetical protein
MHRVHRAGDSLDDLCRVCKSIRRHTVIVADSAGKPLRVICDYCRSQHNYRGARDVVPAPPPEPAISAPPPAPRPAVARERSFPIMDNEASASDLELMLRRVIREECGLTPVAIADRWRDGQMVLRPGRPGLQEKAWPIESFFHKVVMLRNRLRVLEQQINGSALPEDEKVRLQSYITGCYGSLTSFNILFAEDEDRFRGTGEKE